MRKTQPGSNEYKNVAGSGVEPLSSGYEPDEIPFLYPAALVQ